MNQIPTQSAIYRITYNRFGSVERAKTFRFPGSALKFLRKLTEGEVIPYLTQIENVRVEYATISPWVECQEALADYRPVSHKAGQGNGNGPRRVVRSAEGEEAFQRIKAKRAATLTLPNRAAGKAV